MLPSSIILTVTLGRSWADHRQIMGRSWAIDSCRKILKISAFFDTVFPKNYATLRFSLEEQAKCKVIFADPASIETFLGVQSFRIFEFLSSKFGMHLTTSISSFAMDDPLYYSSAHTCPIEDSCQSHMAA